MSKKLSVKQKEIISELKLGKAIAFSMITLTYRISGYSKHITFRTLASLIKKGFITMVGNNCYQLTTKNKI